MLTLYNITNEIGTKTANKPIILIYLLLIKIFNKSPILSLNKKKWKNPKSWLAAPTKLLSKNTHKRGILKILEG